MERIENLSPLQIEANNLNHVLSLIIRTIKTTAQSNGRQFVENDPLIIQLLSALERVICHGLRQRRIQPLPDPWSVVQLLESVCDDAGDILSTVRGFSEVTSSLGRLRLWLRLSIMQKHLAGYLCALTDTKNNLKLNDYYYKGAMLLSDAHKTQLCQSLLDLGIVDCNFVIKGRNMTDYDLPLGVINYSQFLPVISSQEGTLLNSNTRSDLIQNGIKESRTNSLDSAIQVNLCESDEIYDEHMNRENKRLRSDIENLQSAILQKDNQISRLEDKCKGQEIIFNEMESRIESILKEKQISDELCVKLRHEICITETKCSEIEALLKIQSEKKRCLQKELNACKNNVKKAEEETRRLTKELESEKQALVASKQVVSEQELALSEMADQVRAAKLQCDKLAEQQAALEEAQWADDAVITQCQQCQKLFCLSRRKHHCRHCGNIFCHECSSNKLCLPSSGKPVRVCDSCHNILLQRYTAKSKQVSD